VTLLFAKYAREVAKALYLLNDLRATHTKTKPTSAFGTFETCRRPFGSLLTGEDRK
jgi:hypothetical protein